MEYILIKTRHNQTLSDQLAAKVALFVPTATVIEEGFSPDKPDVSIQKIPSVIAVEEIEGEDTVVHLTNVPDEVNTFIADAAAAVAP